MKKLSDYKGILPYASELFGVYQPLLGWQSRRIQERYERARAVLYQAAAERLLTAVASPVSVRLMGVQPEVRAARATFHAAEGIEIKDLHPVALPHGTQPFIAPQIDSVLARLLRSRIGSSVPKDWKALISYDLMTALLNDVQKIVLDPALLEKNPEVASYVQAFVAAAPNREDKQAILQALFSRESTVAGYLTFLAQNHPSSLTGLFFKDPKLDLADRLKFEDPLLNFGANGYQAILSPIGIVHLFREYFFEFDSFLGPPVGHIWLSPGGTTELIEINTRKVFTERTLETATETIARSESTTTTQDDLADAVKDENRSDIKFGFTNVAAYTSPFFQDTATANFSLDNAKTSSRETTHKQMRQQSEKLSSEIKKNFKTTFKTSTEVTDTSSKRYVIQNTTDKLVNYELRRKMRKVGVQVQDIGTQLCWHTFVDDPGAALGIAKLVHIAQPAELGDLPQPEEVELPHGAQQDVNLNIPFVGLDTDDTDNAYTDGTETEVGFADSTEHIQPDFPQQVTYAKSGYTLTAVQLDSQGSDARLSVRNLSSADGSSTGTFTVHLDYIHWHEQSSINIKATLVWDPSQASKDAAKAENDKRRDAYTAEKHRRFKEAFYKAARERIKLASTIKPRTAEDLREEERTVVYRRLISQLMSVGNHESKHVISELVRSIFDVDKMLYFVAPEWWTPRLHRSAQHLGAEAEATKPGAKTTIPADNLIDWGGAREFGRDNYYITEDSAPAKLGSSLGWLLQLDGDNFRNAMLNSPWVKAVIPIRLGKEREAISWLQKAHVEGSEGIDAKYIAAADDPPELHSTASHTVTIREALDFLISKIQAFNQNSRTPVLQNPADPEDPRNHFAGSLPTEAVFEHGFYPLKGGVRFDQDGTEQAIISQWMEILPTDQVAALQVEYDPKTLTVREPE